MQSAFTREKPFMLLQRSGVNYHADTETAEFEFWPDQGVRLGYERGTIKMAAIRVSDVQVPKAEVGASCINAEEFLSRYEAQPAMAAALARARRQVAEQQPAHGLARLRLSRGLSQRQLAERMGTQQPAVARWERLGGDLKTSTVVEIASCLGVTPEEVLRAVIEQPAPTATRTEMV